MDADAFSPTEGAAGIESANIVATQILLAGGVILPLFNVLAERLNKKGRM